LKLVPDKQAVARHGEIGTEGADLPFHAPVELLVVDVT
jgi:hypothetical protein